MRISGVRCGIAALVTTGVLGTLAVTGACAAQPARSEPGARSAGPAAGVPAPPGRWVEVRGAPAPGPARYDRVRVRQIGPRAPRAVLVLVPGTLGGVANFTLVAQDLVRRVPGLAVWAIDRRPNAFEDVSVFRRGDPQDSLDYYLNLREVDGRRFTPVRGEDVPYVREWGLGVSLRDIRRVVLAARAGGRRPVILGGHSLGASTALAYAAWDFGGRAGHRDITGLVLIDGGGSSRAGLTEAQARERLREIRTGDPFTDLLGLGLPWAAGALAQVGAQFARFRPDDRSALEDFPLLPDAFRPAVPATNLGQYGFAFDYRTAPEALGLIQVNSGRLAAAGDPRGWVNTGPTAIQRHANIFSEEPGNSVEWYYPRRLSLDVGGIAGLQPNAVTRLLGLRPFHRRTIDVPLYAFQTAFTAPRLLEGLRELIPRTRIRRTRLVSDLTFRHFDPLTATPARNRFARTAAPFLRRLVAATPQRGERRRGRALTGRAGGAR